jgi:ABC-type nickel/cobalt efflux system permease component RcnA
LPEDALVWFDGSFLTGRKTNGQGERGRLVLAEAAGAFGIGLIVSAFLFGFRHGIDWDHIAAITDITSSQTERRQSLLFGTLYALGHALVVFLIGTAAIILGDSLPSGIDNVMERIVGVTLVILGIYVFVALIRHGREFRMRSRWMLIFSGARSLYRKARRDDAHSHQTEPVHVHQGEGETLAVAVAEDIPVSEWHHGHHGRPGHHHHKHPEPEGDAFMNYGRRTAFLVGMIHGVGAETPTQLLIFLTAAGAGGPVVGEVLLGTFLVGLLTSNSLITAGSAFGFMKASENWRLYVGVALLTATFSLVIGSLFILGKGTLLPALFGG